MGRNKMPDFGHPVLQLVWEDDGAEPDPKLWADKNSLNKMASSNLRDKARIITVGQIAKCYRLYIEIFEEEDQDYPDGRIVSNKERAEMLLLHKMVGDDEEMVQKARNIINHIRVPGGDDGDDGSYKPICDDFRKLGFTVYDGDAKGRYRVPVKFEFAEAKGGDKDGKK